MMKTGSNDVRHVILALGKFSFIIPSFFWIPTHFYCIYRLYTTNYMMMEGDNDEIY